MKPVQKGKVVLVGAGCGDPDLITVKGMRHLQEADVVLTDRLVSPDIPASYVSPAAKIIYVGKQCRQTSSTPQQEINELMVLYARDGKRVVRLKGGDVSVFSNILDELKTLARHNIPYEIVPGITAAIGAAAYAGIPLTARNYSAGVRFLTACHAEHISNKDWDELALTDDTLVFYMSSETLPRVVKQLTERKIAEDKQLAVVEQATTPDQKVYTCSLYEFAVTLRYRCFHSPTLVIIGKVVSLHAQYNWVKEKNETTSYFRRNAADPHDLEINSLTA